MSRTMKMTPKTKQHMTKRRLNLQTKISILILIKSWTTTSRESGSLTSWNSYDLSQQSEKTRTKTLQGLSDHHWSLGRSGAICPTVTPKTFYFLILVVILQTVPPNRIFLSNAVWWVFVKNWIQRSNLLDTRHIDRQGRVQHVPTETRFSFYTDHIRGPVIALLAWRPLVRRKWTTCTTFCTLTCFSCWFQVNIYNNNTMITRVSRFNRDNSTIKGAYFG